MTSATPGIGGNRSESKRVVPDEVRGRRLPETWYLDELNGKIA